MAPVVGSMFGTLDGVRAYDLFKAKLANRQTSHTPTLNSEMLLSCSNVTLFWIENWWYSAGCSWFPIKKVNWRFPIMWNVCLIVTDKGLSTAREQLLLHELGDFVDTRELEVQLTTVYQWFGCFCWIAFKQPGDPNYRTAVVFIMLLRGRDFREITSQWYVLREHFSRVTRLTYHDDSLSQSRFQASIYLNLFSLKLVTHNN